MSESDVYNYDNCTDGIIRHDGYYLNLREEWGKEAASEYIDLVMSSDYYETFPEDAYFRIVRKWRRIENN